MATDRGARTYHELKAGARKAFRLPALAHKLPRRTLGQRFALDVRLSAFSLVKVAPISLCVPKEDNNHVRAPVNTMGTRHVARARGRTRDPCPGCRCGRSRSRWCCWSPRHVAQSQHGCMHAGHAWSLTAPQTTISVHMRVKHTHTHTHTH